MKDDRYPHIFNTKLKQDSESKQKWKTDKGGGYLSVGLGGSITGRGADLLIIDDPIKNQEEALSETYREKIWNYYTSTLYTRLEKDAAIILILTRWHQDDLAGRLITQMEEFHGEKWHVIRYPAIAEEDEKWRKKGEPLWPEKYDLDALANIRDTIGIYDWTSLYQQNPLPSELQEFKKEYFKYFEEDDIVTKDLDVYVMCDLAISQKETADNTSIQVIGKERGSSDVYHLEEYTNRYDPLQVIEILFTLKAKYGTKLLKVGIEGVAYQKALAYFITQEMKRRSIFFDVVELKAAGEKEARIRGLVPMYKAGIMYHRKGIDKDLEAELLGFPVGKHDDRIDALAYLQQIVNHTISSKSSQTYYPHLRKLL
jgi:predicted phage terminase large subunit-like protein